jgi:hypothetical protein
MGDGSLLFDGPTYMSPPLSVQAIPVNSPLQSGLISPLIEAPVQAGDPTIAQLILSANLTSPGSKPQLQSWIVSPPGTPAPWSVTYANPNMTTLSWNGTVIRSDGSVIPIPNVTQTMASSSYFLVWPDLLPFSVLVDPSLVDWTTVATINVDMWIVDQKKQQQNLLTIPFLPPAQAATGTTVSGPNYYMFRYNPAATASYAYKVTYYQKATGTPLYATQSGASTQRLVLPPNGTSPTPLVHTVPLIKDELFLTRYALGNADDAPDARVLTFAK